MQVTFVDQSQKAARQRVARTLDRYLPRVGPSTWTGFLSQEGLRVVAKELRSRASRQTSTSCFVAGRNHGRPAFIVGSRAAYNASGMFPVSTSDLANHGASAPAAGFEQLKALVGLAALLHDVGKSCVAFQWKVTKGQAIADPVRHELISAVFVDVLMGRFTSDLQMLSWLADGAAPEDLETLYDETAQRCGTFNQESELPFLSWSAERPVGSALRLLVATHHRLLEGEMLRDSIGFLAGQHVSDTGRETFGSAGTTHAAAESVFREPAVLSAIARDAGALRDAVADWCLTPMSVYAYGRLCLMLGDQYASAMKSPRDTWPGLVANTVKDSTGVVRPAQAVGEHLLMVAREARAFVRMLKRSQNSFPAVRPDDMPLAVTSPAGGGRFAWQEDAARKIRDAGVGDGGFFGVVMVGTGGGKTRGCPAALAAAAPRCRFFLGLGLRSLTLQAGAEYVDEVGFRGNDVATLIGDVATRRLNEADAGVEPEADGTSAEIEDEFGFWASGDQSSGIPDAEDGQLSDHELAALGGGDVALEREMPKQVELALKVTGQNSASRFLRTPVIAATVDQLMACADARRGRHLYQMLRLATSDLVLDEIDLYEPEDLSAVLRLVALAGCFGRKVIIASATVAPAVVESLSQAYREGFSAYARFQGLPDRSFTAWIADDPTLTRVAEVSPTDLPKAHADVVRGVVSGLDQAPVRRAIEVIDPGERTAEAAYCAMKAAAWRLHSRHGWEHEDLVVSAGVVRFANVRSCREFAKRVAEEGVEDTVVGLACYHARLLGLARFELERVLNRMLNRKGGDPNARILKEPGVRQLIQRAREAGRKHVMILIVATPVEETGRDHDFDYAVTEPSSTRALVQLAGRVLRHRNAAIRDPNIAVLAAPIRYWRNEPGPYWRYPGVETPARARRVDDITLPSADVRDLLDIEDLRRRLDARDCLAPPADRLPDFEHRQMRRFLQDPRDGGMRFLTDPDAPFSAWLPTHRRFRRSDKQFLYYLRPYPDTAWTWRIDDGDGRNRESHPISDRIFDADEGVEWSDHVLPLVGGSAGEALGRVRPLFPEYGIDLTGRALLSFTMRETDEVEYSWFFGADRRTKRGM